MLKQEYDSQQELKGHLPKTSSLLLYKNAVTSSVSPSEPVIHLISHRDAEHLLCG